MNFTSGILSSKTLLSNKLNYKIHVPTNILCSQIAWLSRRAEENIMQFTRKEFRKGEEKEARSI